MKIPAKGKTGLYAQAAKIIGQAQAASRAASREIERAEQIQSSLRSIAASKELAAYRENIAIAREKRAMDRQLERDEILEQWDRERLYLRSKLDFQEDERKRLENNRQIDMAIKQLDTNPIYSNLSSTEKDQARQILEMRRYTTAPVFARQKEDLLDRLIKQAGGLGNEPTATSQINQMGITATNPTTGEKIISYDNGKTWQPAPIKPPPKRTLMAARERIAKQKKGQPVPWYLKDYHLGAYIPYH